MASIIHPQPSRAAFERVDLELARQFGMQQSAIDIDFIIKHPDRYPLQHAFAAYIDMMTAYADFDQCVRRVYQDGCNRVVEAVRAKQPYDDAMALTDALDKVYPDTIKAMYPGNVRELK